MYHDIEFRWNEIADVESSGPNVKLLVGTQGIRIKAGIKPYVVETPDGPVEVADLSLQDGTVARAVPFASFNFVDK